MTTPRGVIPRGQSLTARPHARDLTGNVPTFMRYGACRVEDPDEFYPHDSASTDVAKAICGRCEVRTECLTYAVEREEEHGIWGGMTPKERRRLVRKRGAA